MGKLMAEMTTDSQIHRADIKSVEKCLFTLQRGSMEADRGRLSVKNCIQVFRLLQLALEYLGHLSKAQTNLRAFYEVATLCTVRQGAEDGNFPTYDRELRLCPHL